MGVVLDVIREGGPLVYLLVAICLFAAVGSTGALALMASSKRARTAVMMSTWVMATGLLAIGLGVLGQVSHHRGAMGAASMVSPEDRGVVLAAGEHAARVMVTFGAMVGFPALLLGTLCLTLQWRRLRAEGRA